MTTTRLPTIAGASHQVAAGLWRHRRPHLRCGGGRAGGDPRRLRRDPARRQPARQRRTGLDPDRHLPDHRSDDNRGGRRRAPRAGSRSVVGLGFGSDRGFGAGLVVAGFFRADPSDGFPPGTPPAWREPVGTGWSISRWRASGSSAWSPRASCWRRGSPATDEPSGRGSHGSRRFVFAGSFIALSSGAGGAAAILLFTAAVVLAWAWLSAVSVKLYRSVGGKAS